MSDKATVTHIFTDESKVQKTIDGFDNFVSRLGLQNDNMLSSGVYTFNLITRNRAQLEAAYRGSWVVGQMIDCRAQDMTRAGITLTTNESEEDLKDFKTYMSRWQIMNSLSDQIKWADLYGGAIGVLQIRGQKLNTPLDLRTVGKGQFQGIAVFDRWQLNPVLGTAIKTGPDIGLPAYYQIVTDARTAGYGSGPTEFDIDGENNVHHSRIVRMVGIKLPFWQAITEMMWGESVLERLWDRLIAFDSATMSSANLIEHANNRTVGIEGLREIIASGGKAKEGLLNQFEMMRSMQANEGITLMDKADEYATNQYSFSGLSDLLLQFGQQLSGATQIPLVRLFGQSPAGLSSTGESDLRMYYDNINARQEATMRPGMELLVQVMWRSCFGKEPPKDLEMTFTPLWQMSATDKANNGKANTETALAAFEAGVINRSTTMKELRQNSADTGMFSNITDKAIKEAEAEEAEGPPDAIDPNDPAADPNAPKEPKEDIVQNLDSKPPDWAAKIAAWLKGNP